MATAPAVRALALFAQKVGQDVGAQRPPHGEEFRVWPSTVYFVDDGANVARKRRGIKLGGGEGGEFAVPLQLKATHLYPHLAALHAKCLRYLSCDPPAMPLMRMSTGASSGIVRQCSASRLRSTVRPWSGMARRNGRAVASKSTSHPVPPLPHPPAPPPPATPITPGTPSGDKARVAGPEAQRLSSSQPRMRRTATAR